MITRPPYRTTRSGASARQTGHRGHVLVSIIERIKSSVGWSLRGVGGGGVSSERESADCDVPRATRSTYP